MRIARSLLRVPFLLCFTSIGSTEDQPGVPLEVRAKVVGEKGQPIAGAVFAYADGEKVTVQSILAAPMARSDENGVLAVRLKRERARSLWLQKGYLTAPGRTCVQVATAGRATGSGAERRRVVDLGTVVLRPAIKIRGLVRTDARAPIAGARVRATDIFRSRHLQMQIEENCVSQALTDAKGRFTLLGVPARGASVEILAEGYHVREFQHANQFTPLVLSLAASFHAKGTVVDDAGKAIPNAFVRAFYEHSPKSNSVRTDSEGRFSLPIQRPGRYQLATTVAGDGVYGSQRSAVFSGRQESVRLELPKGSRLGKTGVVIRAQDSSGKSIRSFRAVIYWADPGWWKHNSTYLNRMFAGSAKSPNEDGVLLLPGPGTGQAGTARILIRAKGFAPKLVERVAWSEEKPVPVDATLLKESVVEGVVVDFDTGKPLAGAKVRVGVPSERSNNLFQQFNVSRSQFFEGVKTDAKGRFRVDMLVGGHHQLTAEYPGRPGSGPKVVKVGDGASLRGVVVKSFAGQSIDGQLTGAKIGANWRVGHERYVESQQIMLPTSALTVRDGPGDKGVRIGPDGKFRIRGLGRARYRLKLMIPYALGVLAIPLPTVNTQGKDVERVFDISKLLPAKLYGKVKVSGAPIAPGRLLVLSRRVESGRQGWGFMRTTPMLHGIRALVGRDGSFEMPVREGKHVILLVDLATGVVLFQEGKLRSIKPGQDVELDIAAALAMVMVKLAPAEKGGRLAVSRVELRAKHPDLGRNTGRVFIAPGATRMNYDSGVGVALGPGESALTLILPTVECEILARSFAHGFDEKMHAHNFPVLGKKTLLAETSKSNRFELRVDEPEIPGESK